MKFIDAPIYSQQITIILFILALVISIIDIFIAIRICKKKWFTIIAISSFIITFSFVFLTMRGSFLYRSNRPVFEPSLTIIKWPFALIVSLAIVFFLLTISLLLYAFIKGNNNLSLVSIKESIDLLPKGICFYESSGLVLLINREMNYLSALLFKEALLNGINFWYKLTHAQLEKGFKLLNKSESPIIECSNGKIISFKKYIRILNRKEIYELVASDITEEYLLMKELENKQERLQIVNQRLISYGQNVSQITREKEILSAKIRIHDDIGKLLLVTKEKLSQNLTKEDEDRLLSFWKVEINSLKTVEKPKKKSNLQVILDAAKLVNVKIEFKGKYPSNNTLNEKILIQALHECLTNTVSHAKGKKMTVILENNNDEFIIKITNDGLKPKGKIIEGGGLSSLRSLVERENGKMIINSEPQFELLIKLLKGVRG